MEGCSLQSNKHPREETKDRRGRLLPGDQKSDSQHSPTVPLSLYGGHMALCHFCQSSWASTLCYLTVWLPSTYFCLLGSPAHSRKRASRCIKFILTPGAVTCRWDDEVMGHRWLPGLMPSEGTAGGGQFQRKEHDWGAPPKYTCWNTKPSAHSGM